MKHHEGGCGMSDRAEMGKTQLILSMMQGFDGQIKGVRSDIKMYRDEHLEFASMVVKDKRILEERMRQQEVYCAQKHGTGSEDSICKGWFKGTKGIHAFYFTATLAFLLLLQYGSDFVLKVMNIFK